jgi:hypothetical protein
MRFALRVSLVLAGIFATHAQAADLRPAAEALADFRPSIMPEGAADQGASAAPSWPALHRAAEAALSWSKSLQRPREIEGLIAASALERSAVPQTKIDLVEERIVMAFQAAAEAERRR